MTKWEYRVRRVDTNTLAEMLKDLGNDGWELVGVIPRTDYENVRLIFKRERL